MRSFLGMSLLLLGLLAATYDGFRDRERIRQVPAPVANAENGTVHAQEGVTICAPPQ